MCLEDANGNVRFWLALALARLGETDGIKNLLLDMERGTIEVPLLYGDPMYLADRVTDRGPFPDVVNDLLRQISTDEARPNHVRQLANRLLDASERAREVAEEREAALPSEKAAEQPGDPKLRRQAVGLAATYLEQSPFDRNGDLPWDQTQVMAHLPSASATPLVSALFAHLVRLSSPGQRMEAGNAIMQLPQTMWRSFVPDIDSLFESYMALDDRDRAVRWQLAWTVSRAGLRSLLAALTPRLAIAEEAERIAILRLIEEAILYSGVPYGPVFGGGAEAKDVLPTVESFIELRARAKPDGEPEPRWLQGQLSEIREGKEIQLDRALRAGALHRLVVLIGPACEGRIIAPVRFPEEKLRELAPDKDIYELRIVFWEPNHVPQPLSDTICLPRLRGDSSTCEFHFNTRRDVPEFEGHVVVAYGARVLQTFLLVAQVLPDPAQAPSDAAIKFQPETPVRANLNDLELLQPVDVALIADIGSDQMLRVTEISNPRAKFHKLENIQRWIKNLLYELKQIADHPDKFKKLDDEHAVELLRVLARLGRQLYLGIADKMEGSPLLDPKTKRIQLVSSVDSVLPLELMYERQSPYKDDAKLCPNWKNALDEGECTHCDQITSARDTEAAADYICPLGFWCTNRVIERHAIKPFDETDLGGAAYELRSDPTATKGDLDVLNVAVYAASNHVKEDQIEEVLHTLADLTNQHALRVKTWDAWRAAIQSHAPSILVLLPHTFREGYFLMLEIGDEQQLPVDGISESYVHTAHDYQPPVVLLLGCKTAAPDVPFQGFVPQFRRNGAALVLTTLTPVLGRHAVPVANVLLSELKRAAEDRETFGDALLRLRRSALAAGLPMALSLVAYGDAGWRLYSEARGGVVADQP